MEDTEVRDNDVLFGRGAHIDNHPGNKIFRQYVKKLSPVYCSSPKLQKKNVAAGLVTQVRQLNPPGRFLKRRKKDGKYVKVEDEIAVEKAAQALRDEKKMYAYCWSTSSGSEATSEDSPASPPISFKGIDHYRLQDQTEASDQFADAEEADFDTSIEVFVYCQRMGLLQ